MMTEPQEQLGLYLHLARASEQRLRPMVRDKFLVLAGVCACELALDQIAAFCRHKVLENNPGHLLRKYREFAAAIGDESFETYLKQLQRAYPLEKSEFMLQSLGIDLANERAAYYSDHEYAAVLLGTTPEKLDEMFKPGPAAEKPKPANGAASALDEPDDGSLDLFTDRKSGDSANEHFGGALSSAPAAPPPLESRPFDHSDPSDDGLALDRMTGEALGVSGSHEPDISESALDDAVLNIADTGNHERSGVHGKGTPVAKTPEAKKPEPKKTEAMAPEAKKPEAKQPEAKKPEAKQPEAKKPEPKKSTAPATSEDSFEATLHDLTQTVERLEKPALSLDEDDDSEAETDDVGVESSALEDDESAGDLPSTEKSQISSALDAVIAGANLPDPLAESTPVPQRMHIKLSFTDEDEPPPAKVTLGDSKGVRAPTPAPAAPAPAAPNAPAPTLPAPTPPAPVEAALPPVDSGFDQKRDPNRPGSVLFERPAATGAPPTEKIVDAPTVPDVKPADVAAAADADATQAPSEAAADDAESALFDAPPAAASGPDSWFSKQAETPDEPTQFYKSPLLSSDDLAGAAKAAQLAKAAAELAAREAATKKPEHSPAAEDTGSIFDVPGDLPSIFDVPGDLHSDQKAMPEQIEDELLARREPSSPADAPEEMEGMLFRGGSFESASLSPSKAGFKPEPAALPPDPEAERAAAEAEVERAAAEAAQREAAELAELAELEAAEAAQREAEAQAAREAAQREAAELAELEAAEAAEREAAALAAQEAAEREAAERAEAQRAEVEQAAARKPVLDDDDENVLGGGTPRSAEVTPRYSFVGTLPVTQHTTFETLNQSLASGEAPLLNLFIRADTRASLEQIEDELSQIEHPDLNVRLQATVGTISEADVDFADVLNAIIIGYNVTPDDNTLPLARRRGVQIRLYTSISKISEDLRSALAGRLPPMSAQEALAAPVYTPPAYVPPPPPPPVAEEPDAEQPVAEEPELEEPRYEAPSAPEVDAQVSVFESPAAVEMPVDRSEAPRAPRPVLDETLPAPAPAPRLSDQPRPVPAGEDEVVAPAVLSGGSTSILMIAAGAAAFLAAFAAFLFVLGMLQ